MTSGAQDWRAAGSRGSFGGVLSRRSELLRGRGPGKGPAVGFQREEERDQTSVHQRADSGKHPVPVRADPG
ncbi:hypothetical protein R6Z07F_016488 [Ovis aries]